MKFVNSTIFLQSQQGPHFMDLTETVQDMLRRSGVKEGYLVLFARHTTTALVVQDGEPGLLRDFARQVEKLAPPDQKYAHDDYSIRTENLGDPDDVNGHAHCQALLLKCSLQVPVTEGKLQLGDRQRIFFLELDKARAREVKAQFVDLS